ncbi:MAG TPA: ABC transporter ATP-binding protein/permease [Candidatus Acutalibacter pullicola]|uniref:ABC transporter ATP-binding protein/permease n=1 Tax=Candidatus Acutalibacter pullicola TaxID=2838417 RepID=A0A9D2MV86_9FIRM|nr:ABC transporter ATP-binding protein/permease [Candidatus Acutalibacter pullicola]
MNANLKKLLSFYKPYKGIFFADLLCSLIAAAIGLILPLGAGYITDNILSGDLSAAPERILKTGGLLLVLVLVQAWCSYFMDYQGHAMGARMERDMRAQLFRHCEKLSFSYYDEHPVGDLMSRITNDSLSLAEFFHHVPEDVLVNAIKFVGASVILWNIHWQMTLVILCFLPFMLAYTLYFNKKMAAALAQGREDMGEVNAQAEDSLSAIRMVQSFGNEGVEAQKFDRQNEKFLDSRKKSYRGEALCWGGMNAFSSLLPIAVVVFGGLAMVNGGFSLSNLVVFLLYVSYFTQPIQSLVNTSRLIQEGRTGFRRFMEILETKPEITDAPGARELPRVKGEIRFSHVGFRYGEGDAVFRDLNLTIQAGEYVALVGASGAGKTTLCSLIPRFYDVESGEISLDGIPVKSVTLHSLRENVGVVQQDVELFTGSVAENIAYGKPGASLEEIRAAAQKAGAEEFIEKLPQGYDTDIGPRGVKLSGGQQQRLSIARAFLKDPPILILDEATSALDSQSEQVVQRSLEDLARHRTTLVIAHRLSTIRGAGRILVLDDTGICEEGTHESLLAQGGVYAQLYEASF